MGLRIVAGMVTGHSQHSKDTATPRDTGLRLSTTDLSRSPVGSASADRASHPSPEAQGVFSFPSCVRTLSPILVIGSMGIAWAAAGEIPSVAQPPGHYVTTDQFGMVLFIGAVIALVPVIDTIRRWFGFGSTRTLAPQPVRVQAEPAYLERSEYEKIAAGCAAERKQAHENARLDREAIQRQIDFLSSTIRQELKEHNDAAAERADVLHERISKQLEPFGAVRQRLEDHIHDERAHVPFRSRSES